MIDVWVLLGKALIGMKSFMDGVRDMYTYRIAGITHSIMSEWIDMAPTCNHLSFYSGWVIFKMRCDA